MESTTHVKLFSLAPYRHLFPKARVVDKTAKMGADVSDTVNLIPQIVKQCSWQVERFVNQELKGLSTYDACKKLWNFVKYHIKYEPDERGIEQVRSPRRLIHDAKGDCDCGTTFIDTCLSVLKIPVINRITKYKKDYFQHIYPVVPLGNGKEIIVDFVVDRFNYEEPYTEKKDYKMNLQFLDGIDNKAISPEWVDAKDLIGRQDDMVDLGRLLRQSMRRSDSSLGKKGKIFKTPLFNKNAEQKQVALDKRKNFGKKSLKVVNKLNKVNPATALLRVGILASMKLNLMKVAEKLKWGYAGRELAQSKGMDMRKYDKLKSVLNKTEQIFYAAGGEPENLRVAILTGHGNRNHEVAGVDGFEENTPLPSLLGAAYHDEYMEGLQGLGNTGLGEPATATAITAASATIATIAALLKSMGELFPNKGKDIKNKKGWFKKKSDSSEENPEVSEEDSRSSEASNESNSNEFAEGESQRQENSESGTENKEDAESNSSRENESGEENNLPALTNGELSVSEEPTTEEEVVDGILSGATSGIKAYYQNNKKWIIPAGIAAGVLTAALIIHHYTRPEEDLLIQRQHGINGVKNKKGKKKKRGRKNKGQHGTQAVIALM